MGRCSFGAALIVLLLVILYLSIVHGISVNAENSVITPISVSVSVTGLETNYLLPYSPDFIESDPASLVVWTDGTYYYANSTNNTVFFGGASNVNGVNGSSFSQVVTASCVAVDNITLLSGNYVSDNTAYYTSNDKITGQGNSTFIQQKANAPYAASVFSGAAGYTVSNVTISYMWIDGNNQHQTSGTTFNGVENYRQGIQPMQQSNIWVHDMTITNFTECGYDPAWVSNSTIENCVLSGSNGDIWIDVGCIDFVVRNNTVTGINGVAGIREGLGICAVFFDDDGNHTGIITNNTVNGRFDSYSMEIYWGGSATQAFGVSISNNVINGSGIWFSRMSNCTFENNILTYANSGSGILGVILSGSSNIIIRNNIVNYATSFGIYVGSDSRNNTITLNDLRYNFAGPIFDSVMQTQDTVIYNLGLDGYPPPKLFSFIISNKIAGSSSNFGMTASDEHSLSFYILSTNNTGLWVNDTASAFMTSPQIISVNKIISNTIGQIIGYRWYANNTYNNWADSGIETFTTIGYTITVESAYGSPTSSTAIAKGEDFVTGVTSPSLIGINHRYICTGYSIDGVRNVEGTNYTFTNIQQSHLITYSWMEQYYLSVTSPYGIPTGSGWYNSGSSASFRITTTPFSIGTGIQYAFGGWSSHDMDSYSGSLSSASVTMNNPITETASWIKQFKIIPSVDSNSVINPPISIWVNAGSSQTFTYSASVGSSITSVEVDGSSVSVSGSFTFSNVADSHSISVFSENNSISSPLPSPSSSPLSSTIYSPPPELQSTIIVVIAVSVVIFTLAAAIVIFRRKHWFKFKITFRRR